MDRYQDTRGVPLRDVLMHHGFTQFKKRAGKAEWYGPCPFHGPQKNKTSFSFTSEKFNCFSCGEHGAGAIDLVMKLQKIGFQEAVTILQGITISPNPKSLVEVITGESPKENKPFEGKYEKFYVPSAWLAERGVSPETLSMYGVGEYNNPARKSSVSGKVLFPILRFSDGVKTGYLAREIQDSEKPKYVFPSGFHKSLEMFGAWQSKQLLSGQARHRLGFVVESPLCVMAFRQHGFEAVSPFGWSVSEAQMEILQSLFVGIVFLPDRDKYLDVPQVVHNLSKRLWVKSPPLPQGVDDPEHLSKEQLIQLLKSVAH